MIYNSTNIDALRNILTNNLTVDFVKRFELRNYQRCTREQQEEIETIYQTAIDLLITCGNDHVRWARTINTIERDLFRSDEPGLWFRRFYDDYAINVQGQLEFDQIKNYIKGNTILDFGCGGGRLALKCSQEGYKVLTTDVLDYRVEEAQNLPFKRMGTPVSIPYEDDAADTALVFTVLHHVSNFALADILSEIRRVCSRIVIKEDVYGIPLDDREFRMVVEDDDLLQEFMSLHEEDQLKILSLHDYMDNAFEQGIPEMNFPFQFKTISEWNKILADNGFKVVKTVLIGFKRGDEWTGTCHALFIADRDKAQG